MNQEFLDDLYIKIYDLQIYLKRHLPPLRNYYLRILICFLVLIAILSLIWLPYWRVSQFGINNATENATLENQYRATIAQILGGVAIGISLYYAWQRNNIAQDGQITERFTRAVDQLGNRKIEIRLGGIYALERIANESKKDQWAIMEILTAYVRKNASFEVVGTDKLKHTPIDIQAVLTVLGKRKYSFNDGENKCLNLRNTYLQDVDLFGADFSGADFSSAYLPLTHLEETDFSGADLTMANLEEANLDEGHFEMACFFGAYLSGANLSRTHLKKADFFSADLCGVDLSDADLFEANLSEADLSGADLKRAKNITLDQLSRVRTLYQAELDEQLEKLLRAKYPALFDEPKE